MSATLRMLPDALAAARRGPVRRLPDDLVLPTRMTRLDGLERALEGARAKHRLIDQTLYAETVDEGVLFAFIKEGGRYEAHFAHDAELGACEALIEIVEHEYGRQLQAEVYERVMAQSEQHGMTFEREWVDDDNSIVITLQVNE